jgi:hypothetical protein
VIDSQSAPQSGMPNSLAAMMAISCLLFFQVQFPHYPFVKLEFPPTLNKKPGRKGRAFVLLIARIISRRVAWRFA